MASSSHGEDSATIITNTTATPSYGGGDATAEGVVLKKGPWTAAEDATLIEYVNKHGEGNWNAVQRNSGLQRCGKSCRLRWANHLRPNLKKGAFTAEEERLILELHSKLGNKWARMAAQMPGRTDNEIKNFWNTRAKRHQRAGLEVYPSDVPSSGRPFQHQSHRRHRLPRHRKHHQVQKATPLHQPRANVLDFQNQRAISFDPASQPQPHQPFVFTTQSQIPNQQFNFFTEQSNDVNHNVKTYQTAASSSATVLFNPILSSPPPPLLQLSSSNHQDKFVYVHVLNSAVQCATTASFGTTTIECNFAVDGMIRSGSSGMLDDVWNAIHFGGGNEKETDQQSDDQLMPPMKKPKEVSASDHEGNNNGMNLKECGGSTTPENSGSGLTSTGMRMEEPVVEINPLDDELTSLLDSFPSASPTPHWYRRAVNIGEINESCSDAHGGVVLDVSIVDGAQEAAPVLSSPDTEKGEMDDQVLSWGDSSPMLWDILPTIY